ncbi:MAG: hypothetical protein HW396_308 [Candidatus Dadabacteria bacterium]|nr:hypothetical protein [Candidatus Dadabacteria bacterium]
MVPLQLSLKNFLSYSEDAPILDFRGFTIACLSGKNGHGKSALLDALTWALWGKCRAKNKEEVIKRGAKEARVELEFELEGNRYRVIRTIIRTKGSATSTSLDFQVFDTSTGSFRSLSQGGLAQGTIEKTLKMDYDSFICSAFILQGRADEFTKRTPAERKDVLARILGLERYEELAKKARELAQKSKLEGEQIERDTTNIESEISQKDNLTRKLNETKAEEDKITNEIKEKEKYYEVVIRESEALRAKTETYRRLTRDKEDTLRRFSRLKEDLDKLVREIDKDKEIISKEKEVLQGYLEFEKAREEEKIFSEKLISYTNLIKELEKTNRIINDEKSNIEKEISSLSGRNGELENRVTQIMKLLKREEEIQAGFKEFLDTEFLEKEVEKKRHFVEKLKSRERELENSIQKISFEIGAQIKGLEAKIKELSEKAENRERFRQECEKLRAEIRVGEEIQTKCESLKAKLKEIGGEKKASISRKSEFEKIEKEETEKLNLIKSQADKPQCPLCESPLGEEARETLIQKLEKYLLDLEDTLEEENKNIGQLEKEEKRIALEIKAAELKIKNLQELNKQLGEKEKSLKDAITASQDLELAKNELDRLKNIIEKEDFGAEFRDELKEVIQEIIKTAYEEKQHKEIKDKLESLREFQTESKRLEDAKSNKDEIESQRVSIKAKTRSLTKTLDEGLFAVEYKERALEIENQIRELRYDEQKHKELRSILKSLERFAKEKESLDRAKLSLRLREKELENLEGRLTTEREQLEKTEKELKELEEVISQSEALERNKKVIEDAISRLKRTKDEIIEKKGRIISKLEWITSLENKKEDALKKAKKLGYDMTLYQELDKAFGKNGIQALIIESAIPEIDIEANKLLTRLTDSGMTLSLEMVKPTQKGGEKETLEIKVGDNFGTRSYETFSGGEAFRIDFALRIAISKFIANRSGAQLRTLIIDEGFGTQDKDGLGQFIQAINTIKNDFDKILVITHIDELKDKFPVRIDVTKETGRGSTFEILYS